MISREVFSKKDRIRKITNAFMMGLLHGATCVAIIPLLLVLLYVFQKGFPALNLDFFIHLPKPVGETGGGMANAIAGSLILVGMGSLIGVPWGIGTGIYLSEYGRSGFFAKFLRFVIDLLTSVPSIIVGLFAYAIVVVPMGGFSAYAGGVALAVIIVPIVARSTEEMLKLVPHHIREAGLALGVPRWKVTLSIVLKGSLSGIFTGVILAIARVAGETAPLLFTAFGNHFWSQDLNSPIASLPVQIYNYAISPFTEWHSKAWTGALVLVFLVFTLNLITRLLLARRGGAPQH